MRRLLLSLAIKMGLCLTMLADTVPGGLNAPVTRWSFPDATTMNNSTGYFATDTGKVAVVQTGYSSPVYFILTSVNPLTTAGTWAYFGAPFTLSGSQYIWSDNQGSEMVVGESNSNSGSTTGFRVINNAGSLALLEKTGTTYSASGGLTAGDTFFTDNGGNIWIGNGTGKATKIGTADFSTTYATVNSSGVNIPTGANYMVNGTPIGGGGGGAPTTATYILETANGTLTNSFALGSLATGILRNTATTGVPVIAVAADFPLLNQSTTGSAAKWTTARNLAGNGVDGSANVAFANSFIVEGTADSGLSGAFFMGSLGTGIVKNTTSTGVPSIAVAGDFPTLNQTTTGFSGGVTVGAGGVLFSGVTANRTKTVRDANDTILELAGSYTPTGTWNFTTQSAGDNSTKVATTAYVDRGGFAGHPVYAAGSPPTTDVGVFVIRLTGYDAKTGATTTIFTVPTGRAFIVQKAYVRITGVTGGAAVAFAYKIQESGASKTMTAATASTSAAPVVGAYYPQDAVSNNAPYTECAAGNNVQIVVGTPFSTSTTVTADVILIGFYSQ